MQTKSLRITLIASALLLTIVSVKAFAEEIILFSDEKNWGWLRAGELSQEHPAQGSSSIKIDATAGGWVNHGPHEIPNGDLTVFEDNTGQLPVDKVFIEFYYDAGTADIDSWNVNFQLGGDWANKISKNDLGPELDAQAGYQLFRIALEEFGPAGWWTNMPRDITAMQLGATFPVGTVLWLDELKVVGEPEARVDMLDKLTTTWGKMKS
jgi:hypothetical protein